MAMNKGASSVVNALIALRQAKEHFADALRDNPGSIAQRLVKPYLRKIEWIYTDIITYPHFPDIVRDGIRSEWHSDAFTTPAIVEKIAKLRPDEREAIEVIIDKVIAGDMINVVMS
jgi:hypothetical protein